IVHLGWALRGAVMAYVVAAGVSTLASMALMIPRVSLRFAPAVVGPLMRFGAPLVVAGLSAWLLNVGDRYMLKWLSETVAVGLYDFGSRVGGIVNLLFVQSFQLAFAVAGLRQFDEGRLDLHRSAMRHYAVWTGWFVLALSVFAEEGMTLLVTVLGVDPFYLGIKSVVLPVAAGFWFYGLYHVAANVLYGLERTRTIAGFVLAAAVLNLVLNFFLIPRLGVVGAAVATTVAFATLAIGTVLMTERLRPIGFDRRVLVAVVVVVVALWAVSSQLEAMPDLPRILLRLLLVALFGPLILASRTFGVADLTRGLGFLRPEVRDGSN
ncbi:MAG: polysaccharide biosynthesis C-terminal domain-containing protein, partial [Rhodothermales bacterium]|nr:polysaccharide biosynthesis C-terminal domain-containing protein [Rhodothermales bacterium]